MRWIKYHNVTNYVTLLLSSWSLPVSKSTVISRLYCKHVHCIPGKTDATSCASHVFVTLEAIIHDSSVSDGAITASDQFGGGKADMPDYNCSAQCFETWYAVHLTTWKKHQRLDYKLQWHIQGTEFFLFWQRQVSKEECFDYQCNGFFKSMLEVCWLYIHTLLLWWWNILHGWFLLQIAPPIN